MLSPNAKIFRHCPRCGEETLSWPRLHETVCRTCNFDFFLNVAAAVGVVIQVGDRLLLTRRLREPGAGLLDLPGGFIDPEESAEEGLRREVREELGLELDAVEYLFSFPNEYLYKGIMYRTVDLFFRARFPTVPPVSPLDDISGIVWAEPAEIDPAEVAFSSIRQALRRLENGRE